MTTVHTIELNRGVEVPGIPVVWDTNLSDEELKRVYQYLLKKSFFFSKLRPDDLISIDKERLEIKGNWSEFEVKVEGKTYKGWGTPKEVTVVCRPDSDWTLLDEERHFEQARQEKENELSERQQSIIGNANNFVAGTGKLIYPAGTVNGFKESGDRFLTQNNFEAAEKDYRSALHLLVNNNLEPDNIFGYRQDLLSRHPALNLIELYAKSRKLIKGITFIHSLTQDERLWLHLGKTLEREQALHLAIAVYKEALNEHLQSMAIHKRLAIVCERTDDLQGAIDISQAAIDKGVLEDGTKGGFKGRLLRLKNKRGKQRT